MEKLKISDYLDKSSCFRLAFLNTESITGILHSHDFPELFLVTADNGFMHIINDIILPLKAGSLVMIRARDSHCFKTTGKITEPCFVNIAFPQDILNELQLRLFPGEPYLWGGPDKIPAHHEIPRHELNALLKEMVELSRREKNRFELERLLLNVIHLSRMREEPYAPAAPDWLKNACRKMSCPHNLRHGLHRFFALCGRCPEHSGRELKKHFGLTPVEYLNKLKIDYAVLLLTTTAKNIEDIAAECGFRNLGYFYTMFKRHTQTAPRRCRLNHRGKIA